MIPFRPHHFLCTLCFQGKGYSPDFIRNYTKIVSMLQSPGGENTSIQVTAQTDSICAPCPHKRENVCADENKIHALDNHHAKALGLQAGDVFTWKEAKDRIKSQMTIEIFHTICASCGWKKYGICEKVLGEFLSE